MVEVLLICLQHGIVNTHCLTRSKAICPHTLYMSLIGLMPVVLHILAVHLKSMLIALIVNMHIGSYWWIHSLDAHAPLHNRGMCP